nr:hypothetical protein [Tanacetum cinerariifolium]
QVSGGGISRLDEGERIMTRTNLFKGVLLISASIVSLTVAAAADAQQTAGSQVPQPADDQTSAPVTADSPGATSEEQGPDIVVTGFRASL